MKLWGRDPAVVSAAIGVAVMVAGRFLGWSADVQGTVTAAALALLGVVTAYVVGVRGDGLVAAVMGFMKAGLAVLLAFKVHVSANDQALIMSVVSVAMAAWLRTQLTAPVSQAQLGAKK